MPIGAAWDYRRDRHRPGLAFETRWLDEMIPPTLRRRELRALLTNCGMAAVLSLIEDDGRSSDRQRIVAASVKRVVAVESLTKHAQLGLDRVSAGMIIAGADDAGRLLDHTREHSGTNISDLDCAAIPPPDRTLLRHRLARLTRNAELIAACLDAAGVDVTHPSLPRHSQHRRWHVQRPSCPLVTVGIAESRRYLERSLATAHRHAIPLEHGVGFGFDTTRIFSTTACVPEASTFLRIAPGTEPIDLAMRVADILVDAAADPRPRK